MIDVIPRRAINVSQPLINSFCIVNVNDNVSASGDNASDANCSNNLIVQNARNTQGTFNLCHSFSTRADNPKFSAKLTACLYPLISVLKISIEALHIAIFDSTSGKTAANVGARKVILKLMMFYFFVNSLNAINLPCFITSNGIGKIANIRGIRKVNGNILCIRTCFGPR